jgi:hypothetical protein
MENDIGDYNTLESLIKELLNETVINKLILTYNKLDDAEKKYFTIPPEEVKVSWTFYINYTYPNRGDISTSTLQKLYHSIFKSIEECEESINFKNNFIDIINENILFILNSQNQSKYIEKYKIDNNFINIYLRDKGKALVSSQIKRTKKEDKATDIYQVIIYNLVLTYRIFTLLLS